MKITLRNYRAFDDTRPATWRLDDEFRAFIGVNNSGKPSLLRFFHEARPAWGVLSTLNNSPYQQMAQGTAMNIGFQSVADVQEVLCNRNTRDMSVEFALQTTDERKGSVPEAVTFWWRRTDAWLTISFTVKGVTGHAKTFAGNPAEPVVNVDGADVQLDLERYRTFFEDVANSLYLGAFRNAINVGGAAYYDLQIGQQFIQQWDAIKTGPNRHSNRMAIAVERELQQIFGLSNLEINAAPNNETLQIIVDDEPYQLQEQGAGLAQFIVVLAFVATRKPAWVFIDEPEQNLHPSLQIDFLTTLARYTSRGVVFAMHSIGLARAVAHETYSVQRLPDDTREVRPLEATRDLVEFLGELSFSGYEELGFSRVLLVEGPTEVPAVQRFLRLYGIDHRVVLLPLGGASMINARSATSLNEVKRITSNVSVLIDSERASEGEPLAKEREEFVKTCDGLGFSIHVTDRRTLENYLTDAAIKTVKGEKYGALGHFDSLRSQAMGWAKHENWRIAAEMSKSDLDNTDLGAFFQALAEAVA